MKKDLLKLLLISIGLISIILLGTFIFNVASANFAPSTKSPTYSRESGATAQCNDNQYSYSHNRIGTCSGHGGVKLYY